MADKCIPRPVGYYLRDNKPLKCTNDLQEIIAKDPTLPTLIDDIIKEMINKNNSCKDISNDKKGLIKQFYNILVKYIWEYDWLESCVSNEYADLIKNEMYDSYHKNLFYENTTINFSNWSSCDNRKSDGWFRYVWIPDTQKRREDFFRSFLFNTLSSSYYFYIYETPEYINKRKEISDKLKQSGNCKEYTTCYYGWGKKFNMYYVKNIYEEKVNKGCVYNENTPKKHFIVDDRYPDCK